MIVVSKNIKLLTNGEKLITYSVSPNNIEFQLALHAITFWRDPKELLNFALAKHGYGNNDSMSGIVYESDLEEYDREVEKVIIPKGYVQAYFDHFDVKEMNLSEQNYNLILKSYFIAIGKRKLARRLDVELLGK